MARPMKTWGDDPGGLDVNLEDNGDHRRQSPFWFNLYHWTLSQTLVMFYYEYFKLPHQVSEPGAPSGLFWSCCHIIVSLELFVQDEKNIPTHCKTLPPGCSCSRAGERKTRRRKGVERAMGEQRLGSWGLPQYGRDLISQSNSWFHRQNGYMYIGLCIKEGIPPQCEKSRL